MPGIRRRFDTYSTSTATIFLFNLIVGTGALALPGTLQKAGWMIGIIFIVVLALFSYITVTYVIEALAISNALTKKQYERSESSENSEETPLMESNSQLFEISEKFEIGQMGIMMTPKWCQILIYLCLCLYLYGDLTIYAVVVGKTATRVACTHTPSNGTEITDDIVCWDFSHLTRYDINRLSITIFMIIMGPFLFFNLQKTKILQFITCGFRLTAFVIMLLWCIYLLHHNGAQGQPPLVELSSIPILFGTLVYSFMCQHSVPGLLQPIKNKNKVHAMVALDFVIITLFYLALSLTAIFTFEHVEDIYTLNFWEEAENFKFPFNIKPLIPKLHATDYSQQRHQRHRFSNPIPHLIKPFPWVLVQVLSKYLALFPVLTLSTNFPIIGVTLRNNLRTMILQNAPYKWYYDRLIFPLITLLPPIALALATNNLQILVGIVGSYAGSCVQYLIPCLLVIYARSKIGEFNIYNYYSSFFYSNFFIVIVLLWMVISVVMISVNYFFFLFC